MKYLALASLILPAVTAVLIHLPDIQVSGARTNITWTKTANDINFTIFLSDAANFLNLKGVLARNISAEPGYTEVTLPNIGETHNVVVKAVYPDWVDREISRSPAFTLRAA
ncbi:hypothetical protein HGRIS_001698 [Hohenbuehelia grisea]|uniref:Uncharacterized protein n=1 Tax=Hohenbuehelia grisea TaxID=104357 RepID=A0ABR3JIA9_9AGAR